MCLLFGVQIKDEFSRVGERFDGIDECLKKVDERFNKVDNRLDKIHATLKTVLDVVLEIPPKKAFERIEHKVHDLDVRLTSAERKISKS